MKAADSPLEDKGSHCDGRVCTVAWKDAVVAIAVDVFRLKVFVQVVEAFSCINVGGWWGSCYLRLTFR